MTEQAGSGSGDRHREDATGRIRKAALFDVTAAGDKKIPLNLGKGFVGRQSGFDAMSNGKIDIVPSQKEVIADGDSFDPRKRSFGAWSDLEKSEVGGAAADIDDQDLVDARGSQLFRYRGLSDSLFQPPIKCRLRFFQQTDVFGKAGIVCSVQSELLRRGVKRGRNRNRNFLIVERQSLTGKPCVPSGAQIFEQQGRSTNGRDSFLDRNFVRSP